MSNEMTQEHANCAMETGKPFNPYTGTKKIIYDMMTEDTGRSITDSGDHYGRNWQENRKNNFDRSPAALVTFHDGSPEIIKSTFHFLCENLEHDKIMQDRLDKLTQNSDKSYSDDVESFLESFVILDRGYTYNDEYSTLNANIVYDIFEDDGEKFAIIQCHGGCDARWGFSKPRVFRVNHEHFTYSVQEAHASCDCGYLDLICGEFEGEIDGEYSDGWNDSWVEQNPHGAKCTKCGKDVIVE